MEGKYIYVVAQLEEVHNNTNAVCITKGLNNSKAIRLGKPH